MNTVSLDPTARISDQHLKITTAARDFEAMLVGSLLRSFQESFASLSGSDQSAGNEEYGYMATQAVASAVADSEGLGIAQMIVNKLTPKAALERRSSV